MKRHRKLKRWAEEALLALVMTALCVAVGLFALHVWAEHPAEQNVTGAAYMEAMR